METISEKIQLKYKENVEIYDTAFYFNWLSPKI